jgi:hypothetical protein
MDHRIRRGAVLCMLVACLRADVPSAWACSVTHIYSASEITALADLIVRAKAIDYHREESTASPVGFVTFEVLDILKGSLDAPLFQVAGTIDQYEGPNTEKVPYPYVRKGGLHGLCFARDYALGVEFLMFLRKGHAYWSPLSATNEEVTGDMDPWVRWVKEELRRQQGQPQNKQLQRTSDAPGGARR